MTPVLITFTTPKGFYVHDRNKNSILSITEEEFSAHNLITSGTEEENALRIVVSVNANDDELRVIREALVTVLVQEGDR